ncbi:MAG: heat-shock protein Hsp33 [Bdellovibrio sp.]|nr:MAG: heat-shock protein Hsp33 [Bdellovibrio sp.]
MAASPSSTQNSVYRFVSNDLTLRIAAVDATEVVRQMQALQKTLPLATLGVGRAMVGAILLAAQLKEGQEVGLLFRGNGPLGTIYAEASSDGAVRGYCPEPLYQAPNAADAMNLGQAMGHGTLSVVRHQPFQRQPFHARGGFGAHAGTVAMVSGEVGDDIAHYLHQSHQIRSVVSLGVYLDVFGQARAAGGVMIEVMPGVEEEVVDLLQKNAAQATTPVSKRLLEGASPEDLIADYLRGIPVTRIPHQAQIRYHCPCTLDRVKRALTTLGTGGLAEMVEENHAAQITCQVCGRQYQLEISELTALLQEVRRNSLH